MPRVAGLRLFDSCLLPVPAAGADLVLPPGTYVVDTDLGTVKKGNDPPIALSSARVPQLVPGMPEAFVIVADGINLANGVSFHVVGSLPLALISLGDIDFGGHLRVTAYLDPADGVTHRPGPGASKDLCGAGNGGDGQPEVNDEGDPAAGGGGGGGYGGPGGEGGPIHLPVLEGNQAVGGVANGGGVPATLRGGCWGGNGYPAFDGGAGGQPGGAVALIALGTISISGTVTTSAFGGKGADQASAGGGGGGGGSGGAIWLIAEEVKVENNSELTANGGGGGEGDSTEFDGNPPDDGAVGATIFAAPAQGGDNTEGGDGGNGGSLAVAATAGVVCEETAEVACGGGGGGGGPGHIFVHTETLTYDGVQYVVSPALTLVE